MQLNEVLEKLPKHLLSLVIDQPYNSYTAQDHAVWRYVMKQNVRYLPKVAHHSYLDGIEKAGISIDEIPHMYGMNRILKKIGWAAVAVDGFIPPAAFMEFQAYNVLVIAADIRPIDQIEYTPAPDIIHEAAGHAPIIADPQYAEYLKMFGEIGAKAFSSAHNYKIYEAVRHLSILKADPYSPSESIEKAEFKLNELLRDADTDSEMSRIRNLHWWTVEYGLIGTLENPKIYGAGLLSSIGESYSSLQPDVKKIPYGLEAADQDFDITTRQPQLYVTPDFDHLSNVLDEFACSMALRRGGLYGIKKAIESENIGTAHFNSGLQVTGVFADVLVENEEPVYIKTSGPTALCYSNKQLDGHGKDYHKEGFGSPVGKLKDSSVPLELMSDQELNKLNIAAGKKTDIEFESGIQVNGKVSDITRKDGRVLLIRFHDCIVRFKDHVLFKPEWGVYDMAVGEKIISVFSGAADPDAFKYTFKPPEEKTHKIIHSETAIKLHSLYHQVRSARGSGESNPPIRDLFNTVKKDYPDDWLLPLELYELSIKCRDEEMIIDIRNYLHNLTIKSPGLANLITNGLEQFDDEVKGIQVER